MSLSRDYKEFPMLRKVIGHLQKVSRRGTDFEKDVAVRMLKNMKEIRITEYEWNN